MLTDMSNVDKKSTLNSNINNNLEVDFEQALTIAGFGWFHYRLLIICGLIYANTAIGVTVISFVLPSATCDFRMTSKDKGWLTAAPMLGMVIGSFFWGCLADTKGRRIVLISALILDGAVGILSSFSRVFYIFSILRFVNGFAITGAMGICFPYLGEFQPNAYREKILCWMELFWTSGIVVLPCIAWIILPLPLLVENSYFSFLLRSWNILIALCAVPSLVLGLWLINFPESPKFLIECGESCLALEILKDIFHINTGRNRNECPIVKLKESEKTNTIMEIHKRSIRSFSMHNPKHMKILFPTIWEQTKALCGTEFRRNTVLACLIQFGITTSYYTLMLWFPELFSRYEEYEKRYPNTSVSICDVSSIVLENVNGTLSDHCTTDIDTKVYRHTLLLGIACIPTSLWLPICVQKLGAKFFLIISKVFLYFLYKRFINIHMLILGLKLKIKYPRHSKKYVS